mmetsp:Transcript_9721/g.15610  ORF Transcript_9721/g.15610 Transcript_9721/m.15610 type:complete len:218 (+) Transcript_9721:46-699(+)
MSLSVCRLQRQEPPLHAHATAPGTLQRAFASPPRSLKVGRHAATTRKPGHSAVKFTLDPELAFLLSNLLATPFFGLLILKPGWKRTYQIMKNNWFLVPFSILYGVLFKQSWRPDFFEKLLPGSLDKWDEGVQFVPQLSGVMELLSGPSSSASAWVHLLLINIFVARQIYLETYEMSGRVPIKHSILLSWIFGPLGLLSHMITKAIAEMWTRNKQSIA